MLVAIAVSIGALIIPWLIAYPAAALALLLLSLIAGQLGRIPLPGQGGGFLLSDGAMIVVFLATIVWYSRRPRFIFPQLPTLIWWAALFLPFILWNSWLLSVRLPELAATEQLVALLYFLRLVGHSFLLLALLSLVSAFRYQSLLRLGLIVSLSLLGLLGVAQWWWLPDMSRLAAYGWDPHQGRLVSTWLDPNFFGGLLAITLPWLLVVRRRLKAFGGATIVLSILALLLTESRSSLAAFLVALTMLSPIVLARLLFPFRLSVIVRVVSVVGLLGIVLVVALWLLGERAWGVVGGADPTVLLRLEGLRFTWELSQRFSLIGSGYNTYQFIATEQNPSPDFTIHSRAGADSSLLTILVTTGVLGVIFFFAPYLCAATVLLRRWIVNRDSEAIAVVIGIVTLFIHSWFVNSFLYSHLLLVLTILIALCGAKGQGRRPISPVA